MDFESEPIEEDIVRPGKPIFAVLISGLITSVVALAGVYWLGKNTDHFYIMGWYHVLIIPTGAILVGLAAGSGYAFASWLTGTRISRGLLLTVLFLQAGAYVTAEYVEYFDVMDGLRKQGQLAGPEPSFPQYFDFKTRSFAWKKQFEGNQPGEPLGIWGYVFVLLAAAGFILGGLSAPVLLYSVPYCDRCQRYMKTKLLGVLPASVPVQKIAKKDQAAQEAYAKQQQQAAAKVDEAIPRLRAAVAEGEADTFKRELLVAGAAKANERLPRRIDVSLIWCKGCQEGRILVQLMSGHDKQLQVMNLAADPVPAEFVRQMLEQPNIHR